MCIIAHYREESCRNEKAPFLNVVTLHRQNQGRLTAPRDSLIAMRISLIRRHISLIRRRRSLKNEKLKMKN